MEEAVLPNDDQKKESNYLVENVLFNRNIGRETTFISDFTYTREDYAPKKKSILDLFSFENIKNKVESSYSKIANSSIKFLFGTINMIANISKDVATRIFGKQSITIDNLFYNWYTSSSILTEEMCYLAINYTKTSKDTRFSDCRLIEMFSRLPLLVYGNVVRSNYVAPLIEWIMIDDIFYNLRSVVESWQSYKDNIDIISVSGEYIFWLNLLKLNTAKEKVEENKKEMENVPIKREFPFEGFFDDKIKINGFKPIIIKNDNIIKNRLTLGYKRAKDKDFKPI